MNWRNGSCADNSQSPSLSDSLSNPLQQHRKRRVVVVLAPDQVQLTLHAFPQIDEEVIKGGKLPIVDGCVKITRAPGLGLELDHDQLGKLHDQYLTCGIRQRDDVKQMQRYTSEWKIVKPRFLSPIPLQTGNCPFALQPTRLASGAKAVRATHVLSGARNRCSMASANG